MFIGLLLSVLSVGQTTSFSPPMSCSSLYRFVQDVNDKSFGMRLEESKQYRQERLNAASQKEFSWSANVTEMHTLKNGGRLVIAQGEDSVIFYKGTKLYFILTPVQTERLKFQVGKNYIVIGTVNHFKIFTNDFDITCSLYIDLVE
ncbi:MAG: hypothetical protein WC523_04550 [Patescibacteria group bacterium]